ncbi:MAG TPA: DUF2796 domain-containing protein [Azonexus sp.]
MKISVALALALLAAPAVAQHHHAHHHGAGQLGIVVEGERLTLQLALAQADLVGFERAARTPREQLAAQAVLAKLGQPARLFVPAAAAQCQLVEQATEAPLLQGGQAADGHGDIAARYVYRCARPAALNEVKVGVSGEFARVRTLAVSFAGPQGQKAGRIDGKSPVFAW